MKNNINDIEFIIDDDSYDSYYSDDVISDLEIDDDSYESCYSDDVISDLEIDNLEIDNLEITDLGKSNPKINDENININKNQMYDIGQIVDLSKLNKRQRHAFKNKLILENKLYCSDSLCKGKIKNLNEFPKGNYKTRCKDCNKITKKKSRNKNDVAHRREKNKFKLGKKCEHCGCEDIELLEFDHIDQDNKKITIGKTRNARKILEELEKVRILCIWCHRLRTFIQYSQLKKTKKDYEYTLEEENEKINISESKSCNGELCNGKRRNLNKFNNYRGKIKHQCKKCITYTFTKRRNLNCDMVDNTKLNRGECNCCHKKVTIDTLCCFDFDHLDQNTKKCNIASLKGESFNIENVLNEELKKCQLLCCICHRKKTIKQLKHVKIDDEYFDKYNVKFKVHKNKEEKKEENTNKIEKNKKIALCPNCSENKKDTNIRCWDCHSINSRTVKRPSFEILEDEIVELGYIGTSRKYGVTPNTIKKWVIWYVKHENKQVTKFKYK